MRIWHCLFKASLLPILLIIFYSCSDHDVRYGGEKDHSPDSLLKIADTFDSQAKYDSAYSMYHQIIKSTDSGHVAARFKAYLGIIRIADLYRNLDTTRHYIAEAYRFNRENFTDTLENWAQIRESEVAVLLSENEFKRSGNYLRDLIALRIKLKGKEDTLLSSLYNKMGNVYFYENKFDSALFYYSSALENSLRKKYSLNKESASYYQNIGLVLVQKRELIKANEYILKSLNIKKLVFNELDLSLANTYKNIASLYTDLHKYDSSIYYFNLSEKILNYHFENGHLNIIALYVAISKNYILLRDYQKSLEYLYKAQAIYDRLSLDHPIKYSIYLNQGHCFEMSGEFDRAVDYYSKSIDSVNFPILNVKSYRNLAKVYDTIRQYDLAKRYYKVAIQESEKHFGKESFEMALSYRYYAQYLQRQQQFAEAKKYYLESLEIMKQIFPAKHEEISASYTRLGIVHQVDNDLDQALRYYQAAIIAACTDYENPDPFSNPNLSKINFSQNLAMALMNKSFALYKMSLTNPEQSDYAIKCLETSDLAIKELREISQRIYTDESREIVYEDLHRIYNTAIKASYLLYKNTGDPTYIEKGFSCSESNKANTLLQHLREFEFNKIWNVSEEILATEKLLKTRLDAHRSLIESEKQKQSPDFSAIQNWEEVIFETRKDFDSLIFIMQKRYPEYYKIKYSNNIISLKQLQTELNPDYALIEYFQSDSSVYSFLVSTDTLLFHEEILDDAFSSYTKQITKYSNPANLLFFNTLAKKEYFTALAQLYHILLKPFEKSLTGKNLIIIPDQVIASIPFEILLTESSGWNPENMHLMPYVIQEHACTYAPSATILHYQQQINPDNEKVNVLAVAPDIANKSDKRNRKKNPAERKALQASEGEVNEISKYFKSKKLIGTQATVEEFLRRVEDYSILHFALHTEIDSDNPLNSRLLFYPTTDSGQLDKLFAYEIYNLALEGDLAVLSSCNTARGKHRIGDGIMNLAHAFQYAGIPSIVATLWSVEDSTTSQIMKYYYRNLHEGLKKDISLQQAKLTYLKNSSGIYAHPYFWSGFISIGNNDELPISESRSYLIVLTIIFVTVTVLIILIIRYNSSRR